MIRLEGVLALITTCSPTELPNSDITKIVMYAKVNPTLVSVEYKGGDVTLFIRALVSLMEFILQKNMTPENVIISTI